MRDMSDVPSASCIHTTIPSAIRCCMDCQETGHDSSGIKSCLWLLNLRSNGNGHQGVQLLTAHRFVLCPFDHCLASFICWAVPVRKQFIVRWEQSMPWEILWQMTPQKKKISDSWGLRRIVEIPECHGFFLPSLGSIRFLSNSYRFEGIGWTSIHNKSKYLLIFFNPIQSIWYRNNRTMS